MGHRVNIMLDEDAWNALRACAKGERSKVVNNAITAWFKACQRIKAAQKMDALPPNCLTCPLKMSSDGFVKIAQAGTVISLQDYTTLG